MKVLESPHLVTMISGLANTGRYRWIFRIIYAAYGKGSDRMVPSWHFTRNCLRKPARRGARDNDALCTNLL